jgi:hypothetical protein
MSCRNDIKGKIRLRDPLKCTRWNEAVQRVRRTLGKARGVRLLPYALLFAVVAAVPLVSGCIAHVHTRFPVVFHARYHNYRPHPRYYCYDCHGYRYFDPYYDFCDHFGFRFRWDRYSSLRDYHRRHYRRIRRVTPHFGEYKYKPDYRRHPMYKRPLDYEKWKRTDGRNFYSNRKRSGEEKSHQNQKKPGKAGKSQKRARTK